METGAGVASSYPDSTYKDVTLSKEITTYGTLVHINTAGCNALGQPGLRIERYRTQSPLDPRREQFLLPRTRRNRLDLQRTCRKRGALPLPVVLNAGLRHAGTRLCAAG